MRAPSPTNPPIRPTTKTLALRRRRICCLPKESRRSQPQKQSQYRDACCGRGATLESDVLVCSCRAPHFCVGCGTAGDRKSDDVALHVRNAGGAGAGQLRVRLNTLGNNDWCKTGSKACQMPETALIVDRGPRVLDKSLVDLDDIELDQLDEPRRRKAGPEAFKRDAASQSAQIRNHSGGKRELLQGLGLGQFQHQPWPEIGARKNEIEDASRHLLVGQTAGRQIAGENSAGINLKLIENQSEHVAVEWRGSSACLQAWMELR